MAEQRQFSHSICVKIDAKTEAKLELFPAEQWADGVAGAYRVRLNRKWVRNGAARQYLTPERIGLLVAELLKGALLDEGIVPNLPVGSQMRVRRDPADPYSYQRVYTRTEPFRGWDGLWYVLVHVYGRGTDMVPINSLEPVTR
ncbi:hypothetical protein [Oleidesulfovibrio sp.]|uniref:hypothetical protein n=1 Tax=Oleidesulfovibrio sp. TaxID=2909707 RepID=UPI003A8BF08E